MNDRRIREAEGFIALGKGLIDIGNRAAAISTSQGEYTALKNSQYAEAAKTAEGETPPEPADTPEMAELKAGTVAKLKDCLARIQTLSAYLSGINESLGGGKYADELKLLEDYEASFTRSYDDYSK